MTQSGMGVKSSNRQYMWTPLKNSLPGLLKARTVPIMMFGSNLVRVHTVLLSTAHYCHFTEESLPSSMAMSSFSAHFVSSATTLLPILTAQVT